jgi:hypothetical protein
MGLQNHSKPRQATKFRRVTNIAQISFSTETLSQSLRTIRHFPHIRHFPNTGFAQSGFIGSFRFDTSQNVEQDVIRGMRKCLWRVSRTLVAQNAEKRCHCESSSLKDRVSICRLSNVRNAITPKPWWRR